MGRSWLNGLIVGMIIGYFPYFLVSTFIVEKNVKQSIERGYIILKGKSYKLTPVDVKTILVEKEQTND